MKISILSVLDVPEEKKREQYIKQAAQRHFEEWGAHLKNVTSQSWYENLSKKINSQSQQMFVALNSKGQLVGVLGWKKQNMTDDPQKRYDQYSPWPTGLYVEKSARKKKISYLLFQHLAELALNKDSPLSQYSEFYSFTHDSKLIPFYKKLGLERVPDPENAPFSYGVKNEPIVLFKGNPEVILQKIKNVIERNYTVTVNEQGVRECVRKPPESIPQITLKYMLWGIGELPVFTHPDEELADAKGLEL